MFKLIKEPEENPSNLLNSYRLQNIIMQKMRMLHTAFDGIKLNHWNDTDRELPDILAGSICEFEGRLFETNQIIKLIDNITDSNRDLRYIKLVIHRDNEDSNNDYLTVEIASGSSNGNEDFPNYDYENRGFYVKNDNNIIIEKYLRLSMKYDASLGGYVEKKYWNINDFQRKGLTLKRKTVNFGVGTHEFTFPSDVNSITVHITSGGGGAGMTIIETGDNGYHNATNGGNSQVLINDAAITTCGGGGCGKMTGLATGSGLAGQASGQGKLYQGSDGYKGTPGRGGILNSQCLASGGNGGDGIAHNIGNKGSIGGGSGSAAIVDINRDMLGVSYKIKIIVGAGGVSGYMDGNPTRMNNGENGSAVIEYMQK
ncbi:hypothetical protein SZ47_12305 [Brachyspira hyodysenteriae]|uniref:Uncharacterized protein n=1 Tax=Brachyspira hyodysenteriae ATCC 27164 TaxID=1266923 RepID=A0A3B6VXN3_BRAHO|nr:hypothetical protein [Brachyspira hyodysenteriae]ANN64632.1 hypothetical protein BHYOB78_12400 [Brachyspira hyodysenteriae ATCC 27164]KLI22759.1 hypothetical protein SZ47_12305 [Brachyspira hyodysenteriae]